MPPAIKSTAYAQNTGAACQFGMLSSTRRVPGHALWRCCQLTRPSTSAVRGRPRKKQSTQAPAEGVEPQTSAAPILSCGPKSKVFDALEQYVAFSDLHVSPKSFRTCLQVLDKVHDEAVKRNAGILFLGTRRCRRGRSHSGRKAASFNIVLQLWFIAACSL